MSLPSGFIITTIKLTTSDCFVHSFVHEVVGVCFPLVLFGTELIHRVHAHKNFKGA